jgi:hypothetical protein
MFDHISLGQVDEIPIELSVFDLNSLDELGFASAFGHTALL